MAIIIFLPPLVPIDKDNWWHQSRLIPEFQAFEDSARTIFSQMAEALSPSYVVIFSSFLRLFYVWHSRNGRQKQC